MKVLFVSPFPPAQDGIGTHTRGLAAALRAGGHEVRVAVPHLLPGNPGEVLGSIGWRPAELAALRGLITGWQPDVIHVQFAVAAFGARAVPLLRLLDALRRERTAPLIVTMHEVTRDTATLRAAGRLIYRRLAARCAAVIVHTHAAFSVLTGPVGVPPGKVTVIPHPRPQPPLPGTAEGDLRARFGLGNARVLLAFGFIHVDKGLGDLVRALTTADLSASGVLDDVRIVVAGGVRPRRGPLRVFQVRDRQHLRQVLRQARRGGVQSRLTLTGYVPDGDIAGWFGAAEAVLLPYRRIEQSGVAALASALGVPVLASTAGGLSELFAGSPWTFPPGTRPRWPGCSRAFSAPRRGGERPRPLAAGPPIQPRSRRRPATFTRWRGATPRRRC